MWYAMIYLLFIGVCFRVGFAYTLRDYFRIAFLVASIFAVFALHPSGILEKLFTQSTAHDIIELLQHELVSIKLVYFFFALANGSFTVETNVEWSPVFGLFRYTA